jgi:hypothetical protein
MTTSDSSLSEPLTVAEVDVKRLAKAAYEDRPPTGPRPVPWTPVKRREWTAWASRIASRLTDPEAEPGQFEETK